MEQPLDDVFPKEFDTAAVEERCRKLWEDGGIHRYDPEGQGEVFSVDTPPPYVSAAHLHVGHAMSYTQAEFVVRYQRMKGRRVFYPMGFDDNGLPTERYVEKTYKINKRKTTRSEFRELCLKATREGAEVYEKLWRALGLSVDWRLRYSTIDDHCRRTAQKSFLDLWRRGRVYRSSEPVLWDTHFETALAQADLESITRNGRLHEVAFAGPPDSDGSELVIATSRPELIPACVGLYCHPSDERHAGRIGKKARAPISGQEVEIRADEEVDPKFGTGLMMVCTFGDGEDVRRWKRDKLATRICIGPDGRMTAQAGAYERLTVEEARKKIVADLTAAGALKSSKNVEQTVSVSERSEVPVEFVMAPQWFIRVLDRKPELLARSAELQWSPEWMKVRLDHWIEGLKYDWNISRQRFYGVPFPLWYCEGCGEIALAREQDLPVDPLEDACPAASCAKCGGKAFRGEPDVMDTWMTSSLTPLVNANWAKSDGRLGAMDLYPLTVRVQAFEIIRTWLFYTLAKSHEHTASLPWRDVMVSGWGLNENGKKISKRDLEQFTDATGYNRYDPYAVVQKFGADALRYWAAGSHLGHDMRYNERDVKDGRRLVVKLWNAARFCLGTFGAKAPVPVDFARRTPEDRWVLSELHKVLPAIDAGFARYEYAVAREQIDRFFWQVFCDDYLEILKDRFWNPDRYSDESRASARASLWESLRALISLYAPFLPFVTEEIYQRIFREHERGVSLHVTRWPEADANKAADVPEMKVVHGILRPVRALRTERKIAQTRELARLVIDVDGASPEIASALRAMEPSVRAVARAAELVWGPATQPSELEGVRLEIAE